LNVICLIIFSKTKLKNESIKKQTESYNVDIGVLRTSEAINPSKFGEILPKTFYVEVSFSYTECTRNTVIAHAYCMYPMLLQTLTYLLTYSMLQSPS